MFRFYLRTTQRTHSIHRRSNSLRAFGSFPPPKQLVDLNNSNRNRQSAHSSSPQLSSSEQTDLSCLPSSETTSESSAFARKSIVALSVASVAAVVASAAFLNSDSGGDSSPNPSLRRASLEHAIQRWNDSFNRVAHHVKQTGVAASILSQSLRSLLSSANHEVRVGFEMRVAALLADISAASAARRAALVGAGRGAVVDWLLEIVSAPGAGNGAQDEAARALAYLIADSDVSQIALARPHAVPSLLRFIFSCQPRIKKHPRSSFDISGSLKGKSMLVAAIMDIVTSNCESAEKLSFKPTLPSNAEMRDIAAAIQVIEEGGMDLDEPTKYEGDGNGGPGMRGIGIKVLGGTSVLGFSRTGEFMELGCLDKHSEGTTPEMLALLSERDSAFSRSNLSSAVIPGLWDDLHCQHVAVPFAAWALANWAMASGTNRSHIQELDHDGYAVMTALMAPERSVKWHGSLVARLLLEDRNLPLNDSVSDWSSSLLATVSHASKTEDMPLAQVALSAFLLSVDRSQEAQKIVMERGLHLMRDCAKHTWKHKRVQESLAKALELLSTGTLHLPLEESQKWSSILLPWVLGEISSDSTQSSASRVLSFILEDYGPSAIPISQGWLALILNGILSSHKPSNKASNRPKNENLKASMDTTKAIYATQAANQLVVAIVNLAVTQLGADFNSMDTFPLLDLLSLEPFAGKFKKVEQDNPPRIDAADSALATLRAIKALTEICVEDSSLQCEIVDYGILCLLRRFLLCDDYEKLAAMEAYDACGAWESQEQALENSGESSNTEVRDSSSVRVPATSHIRRHAARLLNVISLLPKVQEAIAADEPWCQWLEDCAGGKIQSCSDPKIQSYARSILLNIICSQQARASSGRQSISETAISNKNHICPQYGDMIFLINPGLPHWKFPENIEAADAVANSVTDDNPTKKLSDGSNLPISSDASKRVSYLDSPEIDVVFVHGLRGGPYKTWRIAEDKTSTKAGLVEKIDQEAGKLGTFWPGEWLSDDFPQARLFTLKYKTNLTQWSGATLPLQEVSSMLLGKLVAAGIGNRPVVFVTHSMGGLLVKQILHKAKAENIENLVNNTIGVVFYSCPHFGSKLADMPWRMGLVLRPAPSIGELRSGSSRLVELNDLLRHLYKKEKLDVLSFCETKVTPIVEGYGGWALRMEIVPIESAYPGFGELVVLESTDHINSCKPVNRSDPSYRETLEFLRKLRSHQTRE